MKTIGVLFGATLFTAGLAGVAAAADSTDAAPAVTIRSLLHDMTDRETNARWPSPAYSLREASSHDRRKTDPSNAVTWHSNTDYGNFIRTETNEGRKEWVILDDHGPGAITRFWAPLLAEKDSMLIRFYFDGAAKPAIEAKFNDFICGQGFVRPPLAFVSWDETDLRNQNKPGFKAGRGVAGDMYLPIPFAKGCKVTLDSLPFYYVINYRTYDPGTSVETFSMANFKAAAGELKRASDELTTMPIVRTHAGQPLAPGKALSLDLSAGPAAIRDIVVRIDPKDAPQVLRSLVLEANFDGEPSIWCPIGEFFGAGVRISPVQDWNRTVERSGMLMARWVMPYETSGRLALKNVGNKSVTVDLGAITAPWQWDDRSLHFHANWNCELGMKTRPMFDWNYVDITGRGLYVGDTLTVHSDVTAWYGEGDERIAIDGERVPSQIGTGTEDYYGYAWGMADFFDSPFISMPRRDSSGRDNWRGYTTTSRLRLLDAIPFRGDIRHNMEIWNWADTRVDYAVATFWYGRPGAKSNRTPQPAEAAAAVKPAPIDPSKYKIAGAVECETMPIVAKSPGLQISEQNAGLQSGMWSGGRQLFVQAKHDGDFVELRFSANGDQPQKLTLYATKSWDYGILRFQINGQAAGKDYDAYNPTAIASGPIDLGTFAPKDGKFTLRVEVVGSNRAARASTHFFGLDCVQLTK